HDGPAEHSGAVDERVFKDAVPAQSDLRRRPAELADSAPGDVNDRRLRADGGDLGMRVEVRDLSGQPLRETEVVAVETGHVVAGDDRQAAVGRGSGTDVRLVHEETNARVAIALDDV